MKCRICGNENLVRKYSVKEKQFGLLDSFNYFECPDCGCLQIEKYPDNMDIYYPKNYYSYNIEHNLEKNNFKLLLKSYLSKDVTGYKRSILGFLLKNIYKGGVVRLLESTQLSLNDSILDIGTGNGFKLVSLYNYGFLNLHGIDPYISKSWNYNNNIIIEKKTLFDLNKKYKFVMLNHSLEHMPDQHSVMAKLSEIVDKDNGILLIRIPLSTGYAMRHYKENCVSIDAPRHFYLHSEKSITYLAKKYGFILDKIVYDSTEMQFCGSIEYEKNIFKESDNSYYKSPEKSIFSKKEIKEFKKKANELNKEKDGNIASFYFKLRND